MKSWVTLGVGVLVLVAASTVRAEKPNVIFMLIDDMGARDLGCTGSSYYQTPHIDALAKQSMMFTQAYAACCVCSPTRAAVMTGKAPARLHITDWIPGQAQANPKLLVPKFLNQLPLEEVTLAEVFKANGYATCSIGKWHLGGRGFYPTDQGFDLNVGGYEKGSPPSYHAPYKIPTLPEGPKGEYLTDRLEVEAEKFIDAHKDAPFFLYLPHYAVHTPIQPREDLLKKYQAIKPTGPQTDPAYAALVEAVDEAVGRLTKKLDDLKLSEKTILVFTSDNGGLIIQPGIRPTNNAPLREGKGSPWEGGTRVPLLVRFPGVVKAGSTCDTPVVSYDYFKTLIELAGVKPVAELPKDGESIVPLLKQIGSLKRDTIYWHYPHYHAGGATPNSSLRKGDWKLIHFYEDDRAELYNLKADPYEKNNLAATEPAKLKELEVLRVAYLKDTDAQMATPNPDYNASAGRTPAKRAAKKGKSAEE